MTDVNRIVKYVLKQIIFVLITIFLPYFIHSIFDCDQFCFLFSFLFLNHFFFLLLLCLFLLNLFVFSLFIFSFSFFSLTSVFPLKCTNSSKHKVSVYFNCSIVFLFNSSSNNSSSLISRLI